MTSKIIITSPSLNTNYNVSGVSSVTQFIIQNNKTVEYVHFELGKRDNDRRNIAWVLKIVRTYFKWLFLLISKKKIIVHFNLAIDKFGLLRDGPLILITKILRKKIILHLHGGEYLLHKEVPKWMNILLKQIFSGKSTAIVLSHEEESVIREKYKCKNVFILPNCIDLTDAKQFARKKMPEKLKILFIGRISKSKGIEYLFKALVNFKAEGYLFEFYLAGKGPDEIEYVQRFNDALGDMFIFKGVVSGIIKSDLLKHCNVFVLPSFFEGLPIALLESMAYGLVPIVTPVGSIINLVSDCKNGLIVNIKSAEEIENALRKIDSDLNYRQMLSENARDYIFMNYSPEKYINSLTKIYAL